MADWDRIDELKTRWLQSEKDDPGAREEWETAVSEAIGDQDRLIEAWDHEDIHELRALLREATKLSAYAKQEGMTFTSTWAHRSLPRRLSDLT
ncbi:MAG: hypothetical protein ACLP5H_30610 [Desulfomonilaceae bacterium]